jgi:hypothetical protein
MSRRKIRLTPRMRSSCINSNTRPFHCFDPFMSILWRDHNIMKRSSVCESCFHSQKLMVSHCKTLMILHCCCSTLHDLTLCMILEHLHLSTVCDLALEILDEVQQSYAVYSQEGCYDPENYFSHPFWNPNDKTHHMAIFQLFKKDIL